MNVSEPHTSKGTLMPVVNLGINHANLIHKHWHRYNRSPHDQKIIDTSVEYYLTSLANSARSAGFDYNPITGSMHRVDTTERTDEEKHSDALTRAWDVVHSLPTFDDVVSYWEREGV